MSSNKWIQHVKATQARTGLSYKEAMTEAKKTYKKEQKGTGIFDGFLNTMPRMLRLLLKKKGKTAIKSFTICRTPVTKAIRSVLDLVSRDRFSEIVRKKKYDDMYHLYAMVELVDGYRFTIEKNEVITITKGYRNSDLTQCRTFNMVEIMDLNTLFKKAEAINKNLYRYTAERYNCQDFIATLMRVVRAPASLIAFIMQDFEEAFKSQPAISKIANTVTDIAGIARRMAGYGK